ncbi:hypothetical protein [Spirosoma luteum]|uniref:hypothetical protein n=1 Tax=Spirosoma luteum TaxID=431553 RepID=UPI00039B1A26|nr:hypothetical protein [Spirosoma luteum]
MTNYLRDEITLTQSLLKRLVSMIEPGQDTLYFTARKITVVEPVELDNINLYFLSTHFEGNNQPITVLPLKLDGNQIAVKGSNGKQITILAKYATDISVNLNGGEGTKGGQGDAGSNAYGTEIGNLVSASKVQLEVPGSVGGKGKPGGARGDGGYLFLRTLESPVYNKVNISLNQGVPGEGGEGGPGGRTYRMGVKPEPEAGPRIYMYIAGDLINKLGPTGPKGDAGPLGKDGEIIEEVLDEETFFKQAAQISSDWSTYKTTIGEYYFRAVNNSNLYKNPKLGSSTAIISLALNELGDAVKLDTKNQRAIELTQRIKLLHTPLGVSRSIDIAPDFEGYEKTYLGYYGLVAEIRRIAENYYNIADIKSNIQTVLNAESASVLAYQQSIIINLNSKIKPLIKQKQDDIDKRIKIDQKLSNEIDARKQFLANQHHGIGFAEIFAYVEVVVAVVGAIYTAGATLVAAAQGLMTIAKSGSKMIDAIEEIKSIKEAKTAIGEFIDVANGNKKPKDTTHEKLISSADDFISAIGKFDKNANKFKDNIEIILNINKAISQIKGVKTGDAELDTLLGQKADNMHEVLIAKKDLELLGYDEVVANRQIKAFGLVAEQINNQAATLGLGANNFLVQFAHIIKRSQFYMDFLIEQVFYAIRSLEILEFTDLSNLIRYDYGYFHPDLEADLNELNDQEAANNVLVAYNNSIVDFSTVTTYRTNYNNFVNRVLWSPYTYKLNFNKDQIQDFISSPKSAILRFTIDPSTELTNASGTLTDKSYAILQSIKISFVGVMTQDLSNTFNATLYQSGALYQRTNDPDPVSIVLRGRKANINDVQNRLLTNADFANADAGFGYNSDFNLSYRSVFSYYEISIPPSEFITGNLDFSNLDRIQVWFKLVYRT